jgi:DinB superfamily
MRRVESTIAIEYRCHMSAHVSYGPISPILDIHAMIHGFLLEVVEDVPDARMAEQPGTIVNHPAWTLSHLNAYSAALLSLLDDQSVTAATAEAEMEQFGYGTIPVPDRAAYATKRELLDRFRERNARVAAVVAEKHARCFPKPSPERYHPYSPTIGHIAMTLLIAPPPHHLGQIKQWRRAAGITERA